MCLHRSGGLKRKEELEDQRQLGVIWWKMKEGKMGRNQEQLSKTLYQMKRIRKQHQKLGCLVGWREIVGAQANKEHVTLMSCCVFITYHEILYT